MAGMALFHFSEDPAIELFTPRPVAAPSERGAGRDWLNGPLVWAIDDAFAAMYLFPRDCPRIVLFPKSDSSAGDLADWFGDGKAKAIAHIESDWLERLRVATLYRYEFPSQTFESLGDAGMHVSKTAVRPLTMRTMGSLPDALTEAGVELRVIPDLSRLWEVWSTSLNVSGVRLRNSKGWVEAAERRTKLSGGQTA